MKIPSRKFSTPSSLEPRELKSVSAVPRKAWCVSRCIITSKRVIQSDFYFFFFFLREGYFSSPFFFLSAAACSRGLAVSVWWCNAATVLLQPSRKKPVPQLLGPHWPQTKTPTQTLHRCLLGFTKRRWVEAKGGERKCQVLLMKYRSVPGGGPDPRQIQMQNVHARAPIRECIGSRCILYAASSHLLGSHNLICHRLD